jgi:hypothetical protein
MKATPTVPAVATLIADATHGALKAVVHEQSNGLHDVIVLLDAVCQRIDDQDTDEDPLFRLAHMARERVRATISAFDPYI